MKKTNSSVKRGMALVLTAAMCTGMLNLTALAADEDVLNAPAYGQEEISGAADTGAADAGAAGAAGTGAADAGQAGAAGTGAADAGQAGAADTGAADAGQAGAADTGAADADEAGAAGTGAADAGQAGAADTGAADAGAAGETGTGAADAGQAGAAGTGAADAGEAGETGTGAADAEAAGTDTSASTENVSADNGIQLASEEEVEEQPEEASVTAEWDEATKTLTISGEGQFDLANDIDWSKIPNWKSTEKLVVSGVELPAWAFSQFTDVKEVSLTNVTIANRTYPFSGAGSAEGMTVTVKDSDLGGYAFWNCKALTSVSIEGGSVEQYAFYDCKGLKTLSVEGCSIAQYAFWDAGTSDGISVTVKGDRLDAFAFNGIQNIVSVVLEVKTVGEHAFDSCVNLRSVEFKNVETIEDYAFILCDLPEVTLSNMTKIGEGAFGYNNHLVSVKLDDVEKIGKHSFYKCIGLKTVEVNDCGTIVQRAFWECSALESVSVNKVNNVEQYAFYGCTALAQATLTDIDLIDGGVFQGCDNLTQINIDAGTKLGYLNSGHVLTDVIPGISDRVEAILKGEFALDPAEDIVELTPDSGWTSNVAKSENWDAYDGGTQLVEGARWLNSDSTQAEVKVDAYYTGEKQMDYVFVLDLSNSMTLLGNESDMNARFYDMQSKLLDVSKQLLGTPGYDCRVAFVTFGTTSTESLGFFSDFASAEDAINGLTPYYENTNYGLGLMGAKALVKTQEVGRETSVIFISDGQPRGTADDLDGSINAAAIKELGVSIYGVLQSVPADEFDAAVAAMKNVCSDGLFFKATDTQSFSKAVNAAIAAPYGEYTVTIPVNDAFEDVRIESVTSGDARVSADGKAITWTINGMPFTKHTLTYRMDLTAENADRTGAQTYPVNSANGQFGHEGGASVETPVLTRTVSTGGNGGGSGSTRYTLTIEYVYEDGSEAASTVTRTLSRGSDYSVNSPVIDGYTADQTVVSGTLERDTTVTVVYTADAVDMPDEDTPLVDEPDVDLPDEDVPLANLPEISEDENSTEDLSDEDVPLADVPETSDASLLWLALTALSGAGLAWLSLFNKRKGAES